MKENVVILSLTAILGVTATGVLISQEKERELYEQLNAKTNVMVTEKYNNYVSDKSSRSIKKEPEEETIITETINASSHSENNIEYDIYCETVYKEEDNYTENLAIPYGDCSNYMYMDYRTLTDTTSKQWELQQYAYTDWQGIRVYDGCYMVAMGTYYGQVGDKFRITTDWGNSYCVIMGDAKGWDSVDGWYHVAGDGRLNVVEFIVDTYSLNGYAATMGDMGVLDNIGGDIISIERIA